MASSQTEYRLEDFRNLAEELVELAQKISSRFDSMDDESFDEFSKESKERKYLEFHKALGEVEISTDL